MLQCTIKIHDTKIEVLMGGAPDILAKPLPHSYAVQAIMAEFSVQLLRLTYETPTVEVCERLPVFKSGHDCSSHLQSTQHKAHAKCSRLRHAMQVAMGSLAGL